MANSRLDESPNLSGQHEPADTTNAEASLGKSLLADALKTFMAEADYSDDEIADTMSEGERERQALLEEEEQLAGKNPDTFFVMKLTLVPAEMEERDQVGFEPPLKRFKRDEANKEWYPWPDKIVSFTDLNFFK